MNATVQKAANTINCQWSNSFDKSIAAKIGLNQEL